MRTIPLTKGHIAIVDDLDFERVNAFKWCADVRRRSDGTTVVYAVRGTFIDGKAGTQRLHRLISNVEDPKIKVDHRDHDGLNNTRENIRVATNKQNCANKRYFPNNSGLKGVSRKGAKWVASIYENGKSRYLGSFPSAIEAHQAYTSAASQIFGEFACDGIEVKE